jgi:ribosomal protein S18 acetylase RimI-like enzyme
MNVTIQEVSKTNLADLGEPLAGIYQAAFAAPPYAKSAAEVSDFRHWFPEHTARRGFRLRLAVDEQSNQPVGFAYGFDQTHDHFFRQVVSDGLSQAAAKEWLSNYFRLVEIAVLPEWQQRGIGRRLHDSLLFGLPYPIALLATLAHDTPAFRMYLARGWQVIESQISLPRNPRVYRIMGYRVWPADTPNPGETTPAKSLF